MDTLTLPEELFLLSIHDAKGEICEAASRSLPYGLAGAALADLTPRRRIGLSHGRLALLDPEPTGEPLLDEALTQVAGSDRPRKLTHWIESIGSGTRRKHVARSLEARNVIRIETRRFLWVIPFDAYPERDASAKYWVKERLRSVTIGGLDPDTRSVALLGVLRACRLLDLVFTVDERKAASNRIEELAGADLFGAAVAATLLAVDDAAVWAMAASEVH